jgi:plasmid stability protein
VANLTLTIDEDVLRRARIRALEQGTSVNALVRRYLSEVAGEDPGRAALDAALELAQRVEGGSGSEGRTWSREELYEERTSWPPRCS